MMVCPYCETRNAPGSAVCTHCGSILRGESTTRDHSRPRHESRSPRGRFFIVVVVVACIVGAALGCGIALLIPHRPLPPVLGIVIGGVIGAILAAVAGGGKSLYLSNLYRVHHAALQSRVNATLTACGDRYAEELKKPDPAPQTRLNLAVWHLLREEEDKATQALQTAQRLGMSTREFHNNAGVALARRGSLPQALEMFARAATTEAPAQPFANLAHVYVETTSDPQAVEKALASVRDALKIASKSPAYYDRLGTVFAREERWDQAAMQFQQALTLAESSPSAQADAHTALGVARQAEGSTPEAAKAFATALNLVPGHARALANQGLLQFLGGEKEAGLEKIRNAAHLDPKSAGVKATLSFALCRTGDISAGIRAGRDALTSNRNLFEPYANLGKAYADASLPDVAEPYLASAMKIRPRSWEVRQTMGVVKIMREQYPQAVIEFECGLQINPQHPPLLIGLAIACALSGRADEAKRRLKQAERQDQGNPFIHGHLGWLSLREDSATEAQAETQLALEKRPKDAILYNNLGLAQIGLGAYDVALESLRSANRLDPDLHPVYYHLGSVYALLKQPEDAIKAWETAAKHEPGNADCFANLGAAYYRKKEYDKAATHFRHTLQIRHDRPLDYSNLGLAYARQGMELKRAGDSVSKATALIGLGAAEEKIKAALQKQKQAIEMFDQALSLDPRNVIVHSNRGLACFFANRPEDAMAEWGNVTKLDPLYANRRGAALQREFDDSQVDYNPLEVPQRAIRLKLSTAGYLPHFVWGYDLNEWEMIISDPVLAPLPDQIREMHALERAQRALAL
jgi:tetratricopeptide (TPR) repeat protein